MLRQIKVADLCKELEEKLVELQYYGSSNNSEVLLHPENTPKMKCITSE